MNSWEEICFDAGARYRHNVILFTFTIAIIFIAAMSRTWFTDGFQVALPTFILSIVTVTLFLLQFFRKTYSPLIAYTFGLMSLCMAGYFLVSGFPLGFGHLWIFILPIVGTMMGPMRATLVYNGLLLSMVVIFISTPLYDRYAQFKYPPYFRSLFPIALTVLIICNYLAEIIREKTQQQLVITAQKLQDSAFTDPLTGAFNRRALLSHFGDLEEDAFGLTFAVLDLDFFKKVNDNYGHLVGDRMLCHIVKLIREIIPANALLYRWGGEEFLIVLKTSDRKEASSILEGLRESVEMTPLAEGTDKIEVTVSIGFVTAAAGETINRCIQNADGNLYQAKADGRNCVISA